MSPFHSRGRRPAVLLGATALALTSAMLVPTSAHGSSRDRDGDGMPNRWERTHGLDPARADARADLDDDHLRNLAEYRTGGDPADEDSDDDGHDDGDEVHDGSRSTDLDDRDTDDDGTRDGDEDGDRDGLDNEDEDDAVESCDDDDDDNDADDVSDEDENDYGYRVGDDDSDGDGLTDGDEDSDEDGQSDEDDDDSDDDRCDDSDEDVDDFLGSIVSFDESSGGLVIDSLAAGTLTFVVTDDTEIEFDSSGSGSGWDGGPDDLRPGAGVVEVDLEDDGTLEEIELVRPVTD